MPGYRPFDLLKALMSPMLMSAGEAPKKKLKPPPGMTEELFALSQNLPKLQEFWSGDIKESKGKAGEKPPPNITRTQVGQGASPPFSQRLIQANAE